MKSNGFSLFLSNAAEMYESIDQNLAKIFNHIIRRPDSFNRPLSATDISNYIENSKTLNEFNELSPAKIGKLLSEKSNRIIKFMAFDKIRYDFHIKKIKDSNRGGDNNKYTFTYSVEIPVASVGVIDESLEDEKKSSAENVLKLDSKESIISHVPTKEDFLEPHQLAISPNLFTS